MKRLSNLKYWVVYAICIVYFILRAIYFVSKNPIMDLIATILGIVVGISMFIFAIQIFFIENKKKEALKPLAISIVVTLVDIAYYIQK